MIKDGGVFDQNVTINVAEQTATFHVPLREGADEANVVHDFRKVNFAFSVLTSFFLFYNDQTQYALRICQCMIFSQATGYVFYLPAGKTEGNNLNFNLYCFNAPCSHVR